jgi:mannose-6-phosphate isomerase-like protein (cupin superfamily)
MKRSILVLACGVCLAADPTFLRRDAAAAVVREDELTRGAVGAQYQPLFGAGDADARQLKSIARYGVLTLDAGGVTAEVSRQGEEQVLFVLSGTGAVLDGTRTLDLRAEDFVYVPPGRKHALRGGPARVLVMGFRVGASAVKPAAEVMRANAGEVPLIELASHGPTTKFQLLMGTTESKRDKLAAASTMVSLFVMDFAPGGTNIPHHHETEEEIYFVLRGRGEMVAGGGADGNEGRYETKAGEAWFMRLNTTVGFYSGAKAGEEHDRILAVRSSFPFRRQ